MRARANSGFALPLVLWLITILIAATSLLAMSASSRHLQSATMARRVEAEAAARAGIDYSVARMDPSLDARRWQPDGQTHDWNYANYRISTTIRDEAGKFDLNAGDLDVLRALMQLQGIAPEQTASVLDGLGAMRNARLSATSDLQGFSSVGSLSQLAGVSADTLAHLLPQLTVFSGRAVPDAVAADAQMQRALIQSGKAAGIPVGPVVGSGVYEVSVSASRPDSPPTRFRVIVRLSPRYDGGNNCQWLAWE